LQETPQTPKTQVATPCVGSGQTVVQPPHACGSFSVSTQRWAQLLGALAGHLSVQPAGPQIGVVPLHTTLQPPQCAGSLKLVSQPGAAVQSPKPN
jgi:hypothetical protein